MQNEITESSSPTKFNISEHLPLRLIKSEIIPPAPNRPELGSEQAIDWVYDFAGYTWIAYGAASLLVISHFPNPLSESETLIGPIFRQVFDLSVDGTGIVSAVSWSPVTPATGDVAAALDNCIGLFSYNLDSTCSSSFCWSQSTILVQSTKVETIKWTCSGDGIIAGGIEVILWRKKVETWERAWKFKPAVPHTLVSASWSIEGPFATAPLGKLQIGVPFSQINEANKCVLVSYGGGDSKLVQAELCHPLPISMIQWRPSTGRSSNKDARNAFRSVLLTGCLDGTVRLWSESDDGKVRKAAKDSNDHKVARLLFRVVAVVEVNQALHGVLGSDVFVRWAAEIEGLVSIGNHCFSSNDYQHHNVGSCEWMIGFGPQLAVTLWSIHCLDDFSPLRYPRVTLWKTRELIIPEVGKGGLLLNKVIIARNKVFSPPRLCSLVELLPCNSLAWWNLYSKVSPDTQERSTSNCHSENILSSQALGILDINSHSGNILQVAVHPYLFEVEVAASLDTNGMLLFWSLSTALNGIAGLPTLKPSCKLSGRTVFPEFRPRYTSLSWTPAILNDDRVLIMGHAGGIDCFIVKVLKNEKEKVACCYFCTIPFGCLDFGQGPSSVCSMPFPSTCNKTSISDTFLLFAIWKKNFRAFSWKVSVHQCDLPGNCFTCNCDTKSTAENNLWVFEDELCGKRYRIYVDAFSSILPAPENDNMISSFSVVCPTNFVLSEKQEGTSANKFCSSDLAYHMVTGSRDGMVKLWRTVPAKLSNSLWELVGKLAAHQGPVTAISPSVCGRKIATVSSTGSSITSSALHIWECVHLRSAGNFILEDTISLGAEVVSLNWLMLGDGQSLLGVCLQNELKIYTRWCFGGQFVLKSEDSVEGKIWVCIAVTSAYPAIYDFFWGPRATVGVVHLEYFSLFSHKTFLANKKLLGKSFPKNCKDSPFISTGYSSENLLAAIFTDSDFSYSKEPSAKGNGRHCESRLPMDTCVGDNFFSILDVESCGQKNDPGRNIDLWSLSEVADNLGGSLPAFHPEPLLFNISAGNWKRAYVALQHVFEHLSSAKICGENNCCGNYSHVIPLVPLSNYLEGTLSSSSGTKTFQWSAGADVIASSSQFQKGSSQFAASWGHNSSSNAFTSTPKKSEATDFIEAVGKLYDSAGISNSERMQICAIIDILKEVSDPHTASAYGSLDEPGRRFWVAVKFQQNYYIQRFGRLPLVGELVVFSGLIGWAFHSDCQEYLFSSLLSSEPSWQEMRDLGVGFWYTNTTQLRLKMEKLARQQFLKYKDPKACALLYIALNRLQVLAGLFKLSKDEKDKPLLGFLARNFQEDKNKAAALKNAYVLMGKHQLELAIAFFLLGGDTSSAVTVCTKNLGDEQLALVICRLVEGHGGPLEHNLISKVILPSAILRGDFWLASISEWVLGNYPKAFLRMLGSQKNISDNESALSTCQDSFLDPSIGQYCLMLATKTSMKNAIGDQHAAVFGQWAIWMTAIALSRCGLPLEALECLSSSLNIFDASSQGSQIENEDVELHKEVLKLSPNSNPSNWISGDLSSCIELNAKLDLAMQYISQLLKEHPSWGELNTESFGACMYSNTENQEYKNSVEKFYGKLAATLVYFQQKYSLIPFHLINKIMLFYCSKGLEFIGYHILCDNVNRFLPQENNCGFGGFISYPILPKLLLKPSEEVSYIFSRYIVACSISCSQWKSYLKASSTASKGRIHRFAAWDVYQQSLIWSFRCLRAMLQLFSVSCAGDFLNLPFTSLDLSKYYAYFASTWIKRNFQGLVMAVKPLLIRSTQGDAPLETIKKLNKLPFDLTKMLADDLSYVNVHDFIQVDEQMERELGGDLLTSIPEDERWLLVGYSLWGQISGLLRHLLCSLPEQPEQSRYLPSAEKLRSLFSVFEPDGSDIQPLIALESLSELLKVTCSHISVYCGRQFASYLLQKEDTRIKTITLCMEGSQSQPISKYFNQNIDIANILKDKNELSPSEIFWLICADPKIIHGDFMKENSRWFEPIKQRVSGGWRDMYISILREVDGGEGANEEEKLRSPRNTSPLACLSPTHHPFLSSGGKDAKKVLPFSSPKEIYRRPGELLEALSINSIDQCQAALATNRKGILFFNLEDGLPNGDESEYIWTEAEWPLNGWAGSESTPVPTCVSPGVGLGSRKGTHLGLGGATIGGGLLARPGREVMDGGAFGVPGYAGMGLSSLGWGIQEDFEQFVDTPPTVESVRASSFSTHPSRPFFLVGSSNTHIYLWEFGKDRATATYGVLPAANVPPPYALASISNVEFDHCGQRFVTAALDGTVCTWQLEVGGRSNVCPTESSVCFDNHTSDVTYVTASGSIIAAAGYSSNGVNVVIWDTLAPSATSRASIMCHEGGAQSLSVFDNNIGSGSISPFIVTGGKSGDVGLHDFRYIATGRSKKHKHSDASEPHANMSSTVDMRNKNGDQNRNGMLWYIPKAHSGSVTKISTIPNTSFFLTGSKDGDVKLWDAKTARLVFHWPKLHERYTFLQPSSHSFGGVVRAAVTDIQVVSYGFLTCGGDGSAKLVKLKDFAHM